MNADSNPALLARETLQQLATLKLPPTPDNFHRLYDQISGIQANDSGVSTFSMLSDLVTEFPRHTPEQISCAETLEQATNEENWHKYKVALISFLRTTETLANAQEKPDISLLKLDVRWGETIARLLKQLETNHGALTAAKKREGLSRVLVKFTTDPVQLHDKLLRLIDSWTAKASTAKEQIEVAKEVGNLPPVASTNDADIQSVASTQAVSSQNNVANIIPEQLRTLLAQILECVATMQPDNTLIIDEADTLAKQVVLIDDQEAFDQFEVCFKKFVSKLESSGEKDGELQQGLLGLFNRLLDSTGEWLSDDQWLQQQIALLRKTLSSQLDVHIVEHAAYRLEKILNKQGNIKESLGETRAALKKMVTSLVDNIETLSDSTGDYHEKIESYSAKINQAEDISELSQLVEEIVGETKKMQAGVMHSRDDFLAVRKEVGAAQSKIDQLEADLLQMGEKVHEDHLTGILNRRGLDNAFKRETARAVRQQKPLCLALLDIDNFKKLNDAYGHKVGDDALVYLVEAVKEATRPDDIVARFGGEEFIILLPNARIDEAISVVTRVQRNLTKRIFLNDNNRLLITFSAGVATYQPGESQCSLVVRADEALYSAKRNGKNQVVGAKE